MEMNMTNLLWFFAFIFLAGGNGFGGLFGGRPMGPPPATQEDINNAVNNQTVQNMLNGLSVETANNNYQTALLLNQQSNLLQQQNNTNQINVIQGFNSIVQQMQSNTAQITQQISQLGYQMDSCCCKIQTQMLQQQLDQARANEVRLQGQLDNRDQTQTILNNLGRFVAWAGSGSQAVTTGS